MKSEIEVNNLHSPYKILILIISKLCGNFFKSKNKFVSNDNILRFGGKFKVFLDTFL